MSYTITNNIMYIRNEVGELVPVSMIASGSVKSVNNIKPDKNGNVTIEIPEGFSGDYNDLVNIPSQNIQRIESLDLDNMVNLRDIGSGSYILYGKFKPYSGSGSTLTFESNLLVNILKSTDYSQFQIFYPNDNCIQYLKITDTTYDRTNVYLNKLATVDYVSESIGTEDDALDLLLETEIAEPIISNDNYLYTDNEGTIFVL